MREILMLGAIICGLLIGCGGENDIYEQAQEEIDRGWSYYTMGDISSALLSFERATSADTPISDAYNGLGWVYLSSSEEPGGNEQLISEALKSFQQATKIDGTNSDAWVGLGLALFLRRFGEDDFRSAREAIDKALSRGENLYRHDYNSESDIWTFRGICNFYLQDLDSAISDLEKALNLNPHNQSALALKNLIQGR